MSNVYTWSYQICQNLDKIIVGLIGIFAAIAGGCAGTCLTHWLGKRKKMKFEAMELNAEGKPAILQDAEIKIRLFNPNKIALTVCDFYAIANNDKTKQFTVMQKRINDNDTKWNKYPIIIKEWDIGEYCFMGLIDKNGKAHITNGLGCCEKHVELFYRDVDGHHSMGKFYSSYTQDHSNQ